MKEAEQEIAALEERLEVASTAAIQNSTEPNMYPAAFGGVGDREN